MTDVELVHRAREGDRDAFDLLMTSVIDRLYRVARLILRDPDRAEDAVQETLVNCWRDVRTLRDPSRFDAWLHRLLLHAVSDEARKHRAFSSHVVLLRSEPAEPDRSTDLADRDELARVFGRLSIEHRTVVVLHHYLGMSAEEAAALIGVPIGTARSRLHYATRALRAALDADGREVAATAAKA